MAVGKSWLRGPTSTYEVGWICCCERVEAWWTHCFIKTGGGRWRVWSRTYRSRSAASRRSTASWPNRCRPRSFRTGLMTAFALAALLLAVLGIAGVMAYSVSRRTCEMGVRLALGAEPTDVRGLVLREGVRPIFIGVALGVTVALAFARVLTTLVFEVGVRDPGVYLAVASFLTVATLTACYVPANRASRIDPVLALSSE